MYLVLVFRHSRWREEIFVEYSLGVWAADVSLGRAICSAGTQNQPPRAAPRQKELGSIGADHDAISTRETVALMTRQIPGGRWQNSTVYDKSSGLLVEIVACL